MLRVLLQVLYHVWREHTPLWNDMLAEVYVRMGAPTDGPPADLPHRILVRLVSSRWLPGCCSCLLPSM